MMNRLKELRESRGMNMKEAADALGFKYMTYVNYEKGERQLYSETLIKIADFYDVSIDYLLGRDDKVVSIKPPLVQKYEMLDDIGRSVVDAVIETESMRERIETPMPTKIIPLFGTSFAGGPGEPDNGEPFEDYEVPIDSPAEFAVRVTGDSMEPELHDGEIVLCMKRRPKIGEIVVALVNGSFYVKQFISDGSNIYLRSVNRARKDSDLDIWASGDYTGMCFGTVIHRRIPIVEQ